MPFSLTVAILAAGGSRRLGKPKQLVTVDGEPLIRRQCHIALEAMLGPVVAVLGSEGDACEAAIADLPVDRRHNSEWKRGLSSSLNCAVIAATEHATAGLLVLLCDQYRVTTTDLRMLAARWRTNPQLPWAARIESHLGPPAIIPRAMFPDLHKLKGDVGARAIFAKSASPPVGVDLPNAAFDLDTPEDLSTISES